MSLQSFVVSPRDSDLLLKISSLEKQLASCRLIIDQQASYKKAFEALVYFDFFGKTGFNNNNHLLQYYFPDSGYKFAILPRVHRTPLQWFLSVLSLGDVSVPGLHVGSSRYLYV